MPPPELFLMIPPHPVGLGFPLAAPSKLALCQFLGGKDQVASYLLLILSSFLALLFPPTFMSPYLVVKQFFVMRPSIFSAIIASGASLSLNILLLRSFQIPQQKCGRIQELNNWEFRPWWLLLHYMKNSWILAGGHQQKFKLEVRRLHTLEEKGQWMKL